MQRVIISHDLLRRKKLASKGDIQDISNKFQDVRTQIVESKHETFKWMVMAMISQSALLIGIFAFLR